MKDLVVLLLTLQGNIFPRNHPKKPSSKDEAPVPKIWSDQLLFINEIPRSYPRLLFESNDPN